MKVGLLAMVHQSSSPFDLRISAFLVVFVAFARVFRMVELQCSRVAEVGRKTSQVATL